MDSGDEDKNVDYFFQGIENFRSRWNALNERCKELEASLEETKTEKKQLEDDLRASREYTKKVVKQNEEMADVIQELFQDVRNNSLRWIDRLSQKISSINKPTRSIEPVNSNDENNHKNSKEVTLNTPTTPRRSDTTATVDHGHVSPNSKTNNCEKMEEHVDQIPDLEANLSSKELSTENDSKADSTLANDVRVSNIVNEHVESVVVEISEQAEEEIRDVSKDLPAVDTNEKSQNCSQHDISAANCENSSTNQTTSTGCEVAVVDTVMVMSVENSPQRKISSDNEEAVSNKAEAANDSLTTCVDATVLSENSSQLDGVLHDNERESSTEENKNNDVEPTENGNEKFPDDNNDFLIEKATQTPFQPSSRRIVSICYESPPRNESNLLDDVPLHPSTSVKSPQDDLFDQRRETPNEYCSDLRVSLSDVVPKSSLQNFPGSNETALQGNVNHEEIAPAEEALPSTAPVESVFLNEPTNARIFIVNDEEDATSNGDKSTNQEATPEELMFQIFGSPVSSPDHNSDVICTTKDPNPICLDFSDEDTVSNTSKSFASDGQADRELRVDLHRMVKPDSKVIQKSVDDIISNLDRGTDTADLAEFSKVPKRSCPPSSSPTQEPKAKRSSPGQGSKLNKDFIWYNSDNQKLLKCFLCRDDQLFGSHMALDTHIISTHSNPYPVYFRCHYQRGNCERHFRTTKKLYEHVKRRHIGEDLSITVDKLFPGQSPRQCPVGPCRKLFACSQHLSLHFHQMHRETNLAGESGPLSKKIKSRKTKKSVGNGYFIGQCTVCLNVNNSSEKFKTYQELDEHIHNNHPNPYPFYFRCPFCKTSTARHFKGLSWLNNHIATCHSTELES